MINTYKTSLIRKFEIAPSILLLQFKLTDPLTITFISGQYLIALIPQPDGETARRLYSIASPASQTGSFDIVAKILPQGKASGYFSHLKEGDETTFQGPAGRFVIDNKEKNLIFLATGTGIAPIKSMLSQMLDRRPKTVDSAPSGLESKVYHLFWGLPTFKDLYFFEEFKKLAEQNPYFNFHICLSREKDLSMIPDEDKKYFHLGRVTDGFDNLSQNTKYEIQNTDFYLCGSIPVVDSLRKYMEEKQVAKEHVFFEKFT